MYAIGSNERALLAGTNVNYYKILAYVISVFSLNRRLLLSARLGRGDIASE